jgi:two-component system response regulator AtoC
VGVPTALIVEDDRPHLEALAKLLESEGFEVVGSDTLAQGRVLLGERSFDLVLSDLRLPDGTALELLPILDERPGTDLVLVTGRGSVDSAVEAFRGGVIDYLTKPVDVSRLREILAHTRRVGRLRGQVSALRGELRELGRFGRLVGNSVVMNEVYDQILKVAPTDSTVLITGETGTGKEYVAATLHDLSPRSEGPFCPLNCGAIAPNLIESELFGHEKGSFTGAAKRHRGVFERAHGGTLFLDEVLEMPLELQVKLLRALESREVLSIGGDQPTRVDVRVVAATNEDPRAAVEAGRLREDLLYRLLVFPLHLPPLRQRGDDILILADHFLSRLNRESGTCKLLTRPAQERLRMHAWPGNVRELRHAIERAFILCEDRIGPESLPLDVSSAPEKENDDLGIRVGMSVVEAERILTLATLDHLGEKKKTAEVLGISLKTLYNRLKSYQEP